MFCPASKPSEIRALPPETLRRIVILEARAAPRLEKIEGLWRNGVKGTRGGEARPGSMTAFIRQERLLPDNEIDYLCEVVPQEIVRNQERFAHHQPIPSWEEFLRSVTEGR